MRSTHGCGIFAGPSLELEGFPLQNRKGLQAFQSETSRRSWETRKARMIASEEI
jgi:hypothetical protein